MTKTICDICGKEMPTEIFIGNIEDLNFCISTQGRIWDICADCRESLNEWMTIRRPKRKSCSDCEYWLLDKNDERRRCKYCFEMDEWVQKVRINDGERLHRTI